MKRFAFFAILLFQFPYSVLMAGKVDIEVFNVGQGNCILVSFQHKSKDPEYMLVDIGTSSYKKEFAYKNIVYPTQEEGNAALSPSSMSDSSPTIPKSTKKQVFPKQEIEDLNWEGKKEKEKKEKKTTEEDMFFQTLRSKLEKRSEEGDKPAEKEADVAIEKATSIYVKTVIITHPDADHYGWLTKLFREKADQVDHIILGGLPEHYDLSGDLNFRDWIKRRLGNKSKIYFPTIQYKPIDSLDDVMPKDGRTYAEQKVSPEEFQDALNFGKQIQVSCLSVNPTHFIGNGNQVLRMSDPEDDNADSLVLKIENGKSSAILTGDATGLTTTRILNNYFEQGIEHLKTNVLLASHHGSSTHGSNNKEWIAATQPEFVIISNGLLHGHPHQEAYNLFKQSPRLKRVTNHKVLVAQSKTSGFMHKTQNPIFSTLTNGTIVVSLEEEGDVKIETENEKIKVLKTKKKKKETKEEVVLLEQEERILATPTLQKSSKTAYLEKIPFSLDTPEKGSQEINNTIGIQKDALPSFTVTKQAVSTGQLVSFPSSIGKESKTLEIKEKEALEKNKRDDDDRKAKKHHVRKKQKIENL